MYLHGLMVMAKNVEDHRLVMLRARGPGLFFRGTEIVLQKKKAKFWQAFLVAGIERKFEEKLSKSDAKVLRNCLRRV